MWQSVARRATFLGAATWLLEAAGSAAVADMHLPLPCTKGATATCARLYNSAPPTAPDKGSTVNGSGAMPRKGSSKHQSPPDLKEGTHFAVLSGVDATSSKLGTVAAAMRQADVVLLGEFHDDAVAHALQLALLRHVAGRLGHTAPTAAEPHQQQQWGQSAQQQAAQQQDHSSQQQNAHQDGHQQQLQQQAPPRPLILSLEMFERDVQEVLSEYLSGAIRLQDLIKDARPWSNYMHDYHHLVELCKQLQLPVVAANAPRRYVSLAGRAGSDALLLLPSAAKQWLAPLPHAAPSKAYVDKVQQQMQQVAAEAAAVLPQHVVQQQQQQQEEGLQQDAPAQPESPGCPYIGLTVSSNFLAAQTLWDATMAYSIAQALQRHKHPQRQQQEPSSGSQQSAPAAKATAAGVDTTGSTAPVAAPGAAHVDGSSQLQGPLVVHVCGKFHCEGGLGIPEHLAAYAPDARVLVVVFVPHDNMDMSAEEARAAGLVGAADFVVLTDSRLPRSFSVQHPV